MKSPCHGNGPTDIDNIGFRTAWDGAFIAALDKDTGQEKWRGKRGLSRQAHVTPLVIEVNGQPQLVSGAGDVVQGFDPDSGERLWTIRSPGEGVVPSIVFGQGLVFTSSGYGSPAIRAIRPDGHGDVTATHIAWESRGNVPLVPSFLYADGLLFCVKESGVAACLDAGTGQTVWQERLGGTYGASPVWSEGRTAWPKTARRTGRDRRATAPRERRQVRHLRLAHRRHPQCADEGRRAGNRG
jgi:outer membrane protein assembly factor BamB